MSMEIRNGYNYTANYANNAGRKQTAESGKADETAGASSAKDRTAAYYNDLQKRFDCVRDGSVSISGAYLRECANDPKKAKELEDDLAFFKESCESGRKSAEAYLNSLGDKLVSYEETWTYDDKGNLTMCTQCCGTTGGTSDIEEEQKKLLEKRRAEKKAAEKEKQKKLEKEEAAEKLEKKREEMKIAKTSMDIKA